MVAPAPAAANLYLAPFSRRLMAAVVDSAFIVAAFLAAAVTALAKMESLPALRLIEIGAATGLLATGLLYQTVFSALTEATPGMRYARNFAVYLR